MNTHIFGGDIPVAMTSFTALIVDDEKIACRNLGRMLQDIAGTDISIQQMVHDTAEAALAIAAHKPDVVFLDIEMPGENAFSFLERIHPFDFEVIFVTAYDEYAIKAFKLNAVDYIVKPVDHEDLVRAVEKVRERLFFKKIVKHDATLYYDLSRQVTGRQKQQQITLRDNHTIEVVAFRNLVFVEAMGSYSKITFLQNGQEKTMTMSHSIAEYEELLPPDIFYRIHKSYLVNCAHISRIIKDENPFVELGQQLRLPVGRRRYSSFLLFLKHNSFGNA